MTVLYITTGILVFAVALLFILFITRDGTRDYDIDEVYRRASSNDIQLYSMEARVSNAEDASISALSATQDLPSRAEMEAVADERALKVWRDTGRRMDQHNAVIYRMSEKIKALQDYLEVELVELSDGTFRVKPDDWD